MSDYFERVEAQLLDAVERGATRPNRARRRLRDAAGPVALAAAGVLSVALALAAILVLHGAPRGSITMSEAGSLPALMEVLRRPQLPGDAPATVLTAARQGVERTPSPYDGTVVPALVRRVVSSAGYRVYVAPLRSAAVPHAIDAALVLLTDARDRPVQQPVGVTAFGLRAGTFFISYGLAGRRSLLVQLVPDGVATAEYQLRSLLGSTGHPARTLHANANGNAVTLVQRGRIADQPPSAIVLRDRRGAVVRRALPSTANRAISPSTLCKGIPPPQHPAEVPSSSPTPTRLPLADVCRQLGVPLRASNEGAGSLMLLYPHAIVTLQDGIVFRIEPGPGRRVAGAFPSPGAPLALPAAPPLIP